MSRCKDGLLGCDQCGIVRDIRLWRSWKGLCPSCGEVNMTEWIRGMVDPESVVRKIWAASHNVSNRGHIRKYRPTPEQIKNLTTYMRSDLGELTPCRWVPVSSETEPVAPATP